MKHWKRTLSLLLCLALVCALLPATASAETFSGTCGDNLTWTLDTESGVLTITGTGQMANWTSGSAVPWYSCRSSITAVSIGSGVKHIGDFAFYGCSGLTSVTIPDSVTSIGWSAFSGCTGLTAVNTNSLASWCNIAFESNYSNPLYYAKKLYLNGTLATEITIPDSMTSIGSYAFYGCSGLTSVTIPDSVTDIGSDAFNNCRGLTSVTIGSRVTSIDAGAFNGCTRLTAVNAKDLASWCNIAFESNYSNPLCYAKRLYLNGTLATEITIPDSVTSIGNYAFYACSGLTSITIPESVTSIGYAAFSGCTGLTSITIPDSVTSIGTSTFSGCSGLTSITIPDSVTSIGNYAFRGCSGLTSITIPDSVTSIRYSAFSGCTGLTSITIPDSVTSIGSFAFSGCSGLTSVTIPDSVTNIGQEAFLDCTGLTSIMVEEKNAYFSSMDGVLYNEDKTVLIAYPTGRHGAFTIPDSVTSIGNYAFYACSGLTSIAIPDSVTSIDKYAFGGCSGLTSITIPDSVVSIGIWAFGDCSSLTDVYYSGTEEEWNNISIDDLNSWLTEANIHFEVNIIDNSIESAYPVLNENINLTYGVAVPDGYSNAKMVFSGPNGTETVTDYSYANGKQYYTYSGITPQCIGDTITATLYATKDGTERAVDVRTYSVRQYCVNMLADENISPELRTLISDLLAYGAAAQVYMGYNTNDYVNTGNDLTNLTPSMFSALSGESVTFSGTENEAFKWISTGLTLRNSVAMDFRFYAESVNSLRVRVRINGRTKTFAASDFVAVPGKTNVYEVSFTGISGEEFADTVTASFYNGSTQIGRTVSYSVNAYVCSTQNSENAALRALVRALYNYGASALAYSTAE